MMNPVKVCHVCNKDAEWIVQSPSLQYYYCKDCKVEPIELPTLQEPYRRDDEMPGRDINEQGHMIRYSMDNGFEYSADGLTWHSADYDDDGGDDQCDPYDPYSTYLQVGRFKDMSPALKQLQFEFMELIKRGENKDGY